MLLEHCERAIERCRPREGGARVFHSEARRPDHDQLKLRSHAH